MEWQMFLYGCFSSNGRAYRTDVNSTIESVPLSAATSKANLKPLAWIVGQEGGIVYFGRRDWVENGISRTHPLAFDEAGRPLHYTMLYCAPKGTPLPSKAQLANLDAHFKGDLQELSGRCMATGRLVRDGVRPTSLPDFARDAGHNSLWDKTVSALNAGRPSPSVVIDSGGGERTLSRLVDSFDRGVKQLAEKKTSPPTISRNIILSVVAGIGLLGLLLPSLTSFKERERDKSLDRDRATHR